MNENKSFEICAEIVTIVIILTFYLINPILDIENTSEIGKNIVNNDSVINKNSVIYDNDKITVNMLNNIQINHANQILIDLRNINNLSWFDFMLNNRNNVVANHENFVLNNVNIPNNQLILDEIRIYRNRERISNFIKFMLKFGLFISVSFITYKLIKTFEKFTNNTTEVVQTIKDTKNLFQNFSVENFFGNRVCRTTTIMLMLGLMCLKTYRFIRR
jgi:hypothetical protein